MEAVWPDVERPLRAMLYRRGLDQASADDVVQEVALRAIASRVTYTSARDLMRWAGPVACNLHVDLLRQRSRLLDGDVDNEHPATNDVAGEVADRIELQRAFRGIAALRPADRAAIIDAVAAEPVVPRSRKEAVRLAVRRHRARSRLAVVLEQLAAWPAGWRWARRGRRALATATAIAVPVAAVPLMLAWPPASGGETPPRPVVAAVVTPAVRPVPVRIALRDVARPAPAAAPARRARPVAPAPRVAAPAREREAPAFDVRNVRGVRAKGGHDQRRPDDHTLCVTVTGVPVETEVCV